VRVTWRVSPGARIRQVLVALQRLVNALGPESPATYPFLLPVLDYCTDIGQPEELMLLEDGLHTWLTALRNAVQPQPQLLALFPRLLAVMERSTGGEPPGGEGWWLLSVSAELLCRRKAQWLLFERHALAGKGGCKGYTSAN
jgi:hypothetical protein